MRMGAQAGGGEDADGALTASAIVNGWEVREIADLLRRHADERDAKRLAAAIAAARPIATTAQLAAAIDAAPARPGPRSKAVKRLSRVFQALRIEVNAEVAQLETILGAAEPLHIHDELPALSGVNPTKCRQIVAVFSQLFLVRDDKRIYVFHKSIVDWLTAEAPFDERKNFDSE